MIREVYTGSWFFFHPGSHNSIHILSKSLIYRVPVRLKAEINVCTNMTFWYGSRCESGCSDPYLWLTDLDAIRIPNTGLQCLQQKLSQACCMFIGYSTALHTSVSMGRKVTLGVAKQANTSWRVENDVSVELTQKLLSCIPLFPWAGRWHWAWQSRQTHRVAWRMAFQSFWHRSY